MIYWRVSFPVYFSFNCFWGTQTYGAFWSKEGKPASVRNARGFCDKGWQANHLRQALCRWVPNERWQDCHKTIWLLQNCLWKSLSSELYRASFGQPYIVSRRICKATTSSHFTPNQRRTTRDKPQMSCRLWGGNLLCLFEQWFLTRNLLLKTNWTRMLWIVLKITKTITTS